MADNKEQHEHFKKLFYCKDDHEDDDWIDPDHLLNTESIIGLKICGSCRRKECLDERMINPIKIAPPVEALEIRISNLKIKKIIIRNKKPNPHKKGFWDITIRYIFECILTFYDKNDEVLDFVISSSVFNQMVTVFGCLCPKYVIGTDLLGHEGHTFESKPFVLVKAKAIPLNPRVDLQTQISNGRLEIQIGLLSEITLFRHANMFVDSAGVCAT